MREGSRRIGWLSMEGTIRVAVCDDEYFFLDQLCKKLERALEERKYRVQLECFSSAASLQALLAQGRSFDLYFLDIDLPKTDGITLGKQIRGAESEAIIIFVSAKEELVFEALSVNPFQFIRKRHLEKDFRTVMEELDRELSQKKREKNFVLEIGQVNYCLDIRKTMYIEATGKYLNIYLTDHMFYIRYQISLLEEKLREYGFLRIHKSYLVNPRYIYLLEPGQVTLEDRRCLPVSRHRYKEIQEGFREYMLG